MIKPPEVKMTIDEEIYYTVNSVMKKSPRLVKTYLGVTKDSIVDLRQEIVRHLVEKSIPKWDPSKKVNFKTYLYTCSRNHLMNLTNSCLRKQKRNTEMLSSQIFWNREDSDNDFYRDSNTRDKELLFSIIRDMNLSDYENKILDATSKKESMVSIAKIFKCYDSKVCVDRRDLMKNIRIQYKCATCWE